MRLYRIAATLMAALTAVSLGSKASAACELKTIAEFHIALHGARGYIQGAINGQPVSFLIDTGAAYNMLDRDAAKKLGLAMRPLDGYQFYGVGGGDVAQMANVRDLKIGDLVLHDRDFVVTGERAAQNLSGILGANLFTQTDVELDYAHGLVRLFDSRGCQGDQVVYWKQAYSSASIAPSNQDLELKFNLKLNGVDVLAELDTGASSTVVTTGAARRVNATMESSGHTLRGMGLKDETYSTAVFSTLSVGDETIKNAKLNVADIWGEAAGVPINSRLPEKLRNLPDMLLGADFVRAHHIYIARGQGKMYFSYNGGPIFQLKSAQTSAPATAAPPADAPANP